MILLNFENYKKARIWLNDPPDMKYDGIAKIQRVLGLDANTNSGLIREPSVTMELFIPMGAMAAYACLGLDYEANSSNQLTFEITTSNDEGRILTGSLADIVDEVRVGLPQEFANAVLENLVAEMMPSHVPGIVRVQRAAHGIVGSSTGMFGHLAKVVSRLMFYDVGALSEDELKGLINRK